MKKIRDGVGGELTAEIFETWFPDRPERILEAFINLSESDRVIITHPLENGDVVVSHITKEYAYSLLEEFKIMRGK